MCKFTAYLITLLLDDYVVMCRAHSFLQAAEFRAKPWNFPFAAEF